MDNYKIDILLGLVRDEIRDIERGETSYGTGQDDEYQIGVLREIAQELEVNKDAPLISHGAGSPKHPMVGFVQAHWVVNVQGDHHGNIVM